jgi:hypothetical protein
MRSERMLVPEYTRTMRDACCRIWDWLDQVVVDEPGDAGIQSTPPVFHQQR